MTALVASRSRRRQGPRIEGKIHTSDRSFRIWRCSCCWSLFLFAWPVDPAAWPVVIVASASCCGTGCGCSCCFRSFSGCLAAITRSEGLRQLAGHGFCSAQQSQGLLISPAILTRSLSHWTLILFQKASSKGQATRLQGCCCGTNTKLP